jgi:hypothetical protein
MVGPLSKIEFAHAPQRAKLHQPPALSQHFPSSKKETKTNNQNIKTQFKIVFALGIYVSFCKRLA